MTPLWRRWFKRFTLAALLLFAAIYFVAELFFNLHSNLVLLGVERSPHELEVRLRGGEWRKLSATSGLELKNALVERSQSDGFLWRRLIVRRAAGRMGGLAQSLFGAEVNVMVLSHGRFDFSTSFLPDFKGTSARERMKSENLLFCVTANFHEPSGAPMGWVWHNGKQVNKAFPEWSGVFFVKDGRPWFGPKSLLEEVPGAIVEGSQVYPSVMKNHTVFGYVFDQPDKFFDGPRITYRSLAGVRQNGDVVFVLSGDGGVLNVKEVTEIAHKLDVQHATLLDGGKALQYSIRTEDGPWHFSAFNTRINWGHPRLAPQRSPVYIAVRRPLPVIRERADLGSASGNTE